MVKTRTENEIEHLFEFVKNQYGDLILDNELEYVQKKVKDIVETAEALRSIKLDNSDEPFSVFKPYFLRDEK